MPKYSFECPKHGEFEIAVPVSAHRDHWPCPHAGCKATTEQTYTPEKPKNWTIQPVVVHVGAGGKIRFPGRADAKVPKGYNKVELRTIPEIEKFERDYNQRLSAEAEQHHANEARHFEAVRGRNRSDLRMRMQSMSQFGQDFARLVMAINDAKKNKRRGDPNFHVEILHMDQSNREAQRDQETGWKRKYF